MKDATHSLLDHWPKLTHAVKKDPDVEKRIAAMLAKMSVAEKVAQMIQPEIRDISLEDMRTYGFGSYLNGGGSFPNTDKHASVNDWIELAENLYQASVDEEQDRLVIPTMWGTDAVHGHNNVIGATLFPHNIGLGACRNPALIKAIAEATAKEVMATGIDWVFAPTVAVVRDDRWGRTYEGYSEHPDITRAYSAAIVEGLQGAADEDFLSDQRVIATIKHFVGDGGTENGTDQGDNICSEQTLIDIHAQGYFSGLEVGAQTVMASFNSWHGDKLHGHKYLLTDVLKGKLGFDGLIVGDWNGHGQVAGCTNESCPAVINAGLDVLMAPTSSWKPLYENTIAQIESGEIPMSRIDDAVTRILRVKVRAGLFEKPSPSKRPLSGKLALIGAEAHRKIAAQAVRESLVLLKNQNQLLPLSAASHVFVTGDGADNIGKQSGGWSVTWQGTNNTNDDFPGGSSIYSGIKTTVEAAGGTVELGHNDQYHQTPDVAIVVFGEEPYAEGQGDLDNLEYQRGNKTDLKLLQRLKAQGIPVVALFISGRPLWVNAELNASDAFVAVWLPGTEGKAIADVLFRDNNGNIQHDIKGKLSYSWPNTPNQALLNTGDPDYSPLFPYGYGLTYSETCTLGSTLSEDNGMQGADDIGPLPLFMGGVKKPWQLQLQSDEDVLTVASNVATLANVAIRTIDRHIQEDAIQVVWQGTQATRVALVPETTQDWQAYVAANATLQFDIEKRVNTDAQFFLELNEHSLDISEWITTLSQREWKTISIDLRCFTPEGQLLNAVTTAFSLHATADATVGLSNVQLIPFSTAAATIRAE